MKSNCSRYLGIVPSKKHKNKSRPFNRSPNFIANWKLRHHLDSNSLILNPDFVHTFCQMTRDCNVDLLPIKQTHSYMLSWVGSQIPCSSVRCSSQSMEQYQSLCISPFCLIARCLIKTRMEKTTILIIAAAWTTRPRYATLLEMSAQDRAFFCHSIRKLWKTIAVRFFRTNSYN